MAPDQRYCLECGARRGDPRLPFMDAVVFMEAVKNPPATTAAAEPPPPPPPEMRSSISANASLIAGVGTLLLALGIGVLIGKTGESGSTTAAAPSVITVPSGGATASTETESGGKAGGKAKGKASGGGKVPPVKAKKGEEKLESGGSGASKGVEEVLKPTGNVKFAPSTVKKGESCEEGTAGCSGGKFEGSFFE
jgi:hypothetical protein